jgi:hypothetical protein
MVEDFVIWVGKEVGVKKSGELFIQIEGLTDVGSDLVWTERVGFLWVILWFSWSLRFMVAYQPSPWYETFPVPSAIGSVLELLQLGPLKSE